jgi:hypothetical protein
MYGSVRNRRANRFRRNPFENLRWSDLDQGYPQNKKIENCWIEGLRLWD